MRTSPIEIALAARNPPRDDVFDSTNAAVPRSVSVATAPIARMIAANAPNCARFFQSWVTASAATGAGSRRSPNWSPPALLRISGRNFARSGEVNPTNRNSPATIGRRYVRHDSSSSLRNSSPSRFTSRLPRPRRHGRRAAGTRPPASAERARRPRGGLRQPRSRAADRPLPHPHRRPRRRSVDRRRRRRRRRARPTASPGGWRPARRLPLPVRDRVRSDRAAGRNGPAGHQAVPR